MKEKTDQAELHRRGLGDREPCLPSSLVFIYHSQNTHPS
jgi:hypothetical protein